MTAAGLTAVDPARPAVFLRPVIKHSWTILVVVLALQSAWLARNHGQPILHDAGQYYALSRQIDWLGPMPVLKSPGIRTYAYPLLVYGLVHESPAWLYAVQSVCLIALIVLLRRCIAPPDVRVDVVLSLLCLALPVLLPYALVMLSDLPGVVALQGSLLLATYGARFRGPLGILALGVGGGLLGLAMQFRPAYASFAYLFLGASFLTMAWRFVAGHGSRWLLLLSATAMGTGFVASAAPTIASNLRDSGRIALLPAEGMDRLAGYQLMLGLSLDRWSSNPPPFREREQVADAWRRRGWAILPIPPYPYPTASDYLREVRGEPVHAAAQAVKHVYYAFEKWEIFPYSGRLPLAWNVVAWSLNWLVLVLGVTEAFHVVRHSRTSPARPFAAAQLALFAYLMVTCSLVVAEERFTLAAYPAMLVFSAVAIARRLSGNRASIPARVG